MDCWMRIFLCSWTKNRVKSVFARCPTPFLPTFKIMSISSTLQSRKLAILLFNRLYRLLPRLRFTKAPSRGRFEVVERKKKPPTPMPCTTEIAPSCLQTLYNIPTTVATQTKTNTITVSGFDDEFPQTELLSVGFRGFAVQIQSEL